MSTQSSRTLHQGSSDGYFRSALNKNVNDHRRKKEKESRVSQSSSSRNPGRKAPLKTEIKTSSRYKENIVQENDNAPYPDSAKNLEAKEEAKTQSMLKDLTILHKKKEQELRAKFERKLEMERELRAQFEHDMSIKQQRAMEKWKADIGANCQIEYNKSLDVIIEKVKLETEAKITAKFEHQLSIKQSQMERAADEWKLQTKCFYAKSLLAKEQEMFNTFPIANFPTNKFGRIVSAISNPDDTWVLICSVNMSNAPWRITSRNQEMQLGKNGQFMVQRNIVSQVRRVVYVVRGEVTFMAECPDSKLPALVLKGNVGTCTICWEAVNYAHTAGGTTIQGAEGLNQVAARRRFYFQFNCNPSLSVVLYHMFYDNQKLLEEFFNTTGRNGFTVECFYHAPFTPQQRKDKYGGVNPDEPSQNIFPY